MNKQKITGKYDVEFGKKAFVKLKELAKYYSGSDENVTDVIIKGIQILDAAKKYDTSTLYLRTSPTSLKTINLKEK